MKPLFLFLTLLLISSLVFAQSKNYKNEIGFQTDNDGFLAQGSDRYYTAGNFLYFNHALKVTDTTHLANKVLGFELGQKIFTAHSGVTTDALNVDRPFAGYLYIASALNLLYKNQSNLKLEAQTGFVGPHSYGMEIQDLIHKVFGFYTPNGWQYQIQNDFEVNVSAQYNRLLLQSDNIDLTANSYVNLGTGLTGAGAGAMLRLGTFNKLYNSISTTSTVSAKNQNTTNELFFYFQPALNYVAYNATVQGSIFESAPAVNEIEKAIEPVFFTQKIGGSLVSGHWVADFSVIFETAEVKNLVHTQHQWGSLSVLYRF
jgi:lipid A 3-O-deacylase